MAIAFNNWNDARKLKIEENKIQRQNIAQIYNDLRLDTSSLNNVINILKSQLSSTKILLEVFESTDLSITDSLLFHNSILQASAMVLSEGRTISKWDELLASGNEGNLKSDTLTDQLYTYYKTYDNSIANFQEMPKEMRFAWRKMSSQYYSLGEHPIERVSIENLGIYDLQNRPQSGDWFTDDYPKGQYFSRLLQDRDAPGILISLRLNCMVNIMIFSDLKDLAQTIISYMEKHYADILSLE